MTAGLPGSGIGGLYYLLLAAWMPVRETWLTFQGRSSRARWAEVLRHVALAASAVGALVLAAWTIELAALAASHWGWIGQTELHAALGAGGVWSRVAAAASLGVLATLVAGGAVLRWIVRPGRRRRPRRPPAPGPTTAVVLQR